MEQNNFTSTPKSRLEQLLTYHLTQMLYVVVKLGIPDLLRHGPKSAGELAADVHAHSPSLYRLMRALASQGVFHQDEQNNFSLTPISQLLCSDAEGTYQPLAISYGEPWWWRAWGSLLHSVQTGETAFEHVHGMSLFDFLGQNPEAASIFNNNMTSMTTGESQAVIGAYDFSSAHLLVDVGGGQGALACAILRAHSQLHAILFDLPTVITGTKERMKAEGVEGRCLLVGGDFFEAIPASGDIYILKDILHDWDDQHAISILRNIRHAMNGSARLLVVERVIFPDDASTTAKLVDINMLVMSGGMERTADEYGALLQSSGLQISRIIRTPEATCLIEAMPANLPF